MIFKISKVTPAAMIKLNPVSTFNNRSGRKMIAIESRISPRNLVAAIRPTFMEWISVFPIKNKQPESRIGAPSSESGCPFGCIGILSSVRLIGVLSVNVISARQDPRAGDMFDRRRCGNRSAIGA